MTDPLPDDTSELLQELLRQSQAGTLHWQSAGDGTSFVLTRAAGSVSISSVDGDGRHPFALSIITPDGVAADTWESVEDDKFTSFAEELGELYELARRAARGSTKLVSDLLVDLRTAEPPQ